jgi:hypothetical protein
MAFQSFYVLESPIVKDDTIYLDFCASGFSNHINIISNFPEICEIRVPNLLENGYGAWLDLAS